MSGAQKNTRGNTKKIFESLKPHFQSFRTGWTRRPAQRALRRPAAAIHMLTKQRREQKFPPTLSPGLNTARLYSSFLLPLLAMEVVFVLLRTLTTSKQYSVRPCRNQIKVKYSNKLQLAPIWERRRAFGCYNLFCIGYTQNTQPFGLMQRY